MRRRLYRIIDMYLTCAATLLVACRDTDPIAGPGEPQPQPEPEVPAPATLSGRVLNFGTGQPVVGASVLVGDVTTESDADGRFRVTDLAPSVIKVNLSALGFEDLDEAVVIPEGGLNRVFQVRRVELQAFGDFAMYVPGSVRSVRGVVLALGGPDTRGFASGGTFGAPVPDVEASLQTLGVRFRDMAARRDLAIMGTSLSGMGNDVASDELLASALAEAAALTGRPELETVPLLLYGMSGGAAQASGLAARQPDRTIGLFLKVPASVEPPVGVPALSVPAFVVLAEEDVFVDNDAIRERFAAARQAGGRWALATERAVPHHSLTPRQRELTAQWMDDVLDLRLGGTAEGQMNEVPELTGWLGDPISGELSELQTFAGSPEAASWLPSNETAERWYGLGQAAGPTAYSLRMSPKELTTRRGWEGWPAYLFVAIRDETGAPVENPAVQWTSDREDVATPSIDYLCAPGCQEWAYIVSHAEGVAHISATYGTYEPVTATVTVLPAVSLTVSPTEATIPVGGTVDLVVRVVDEHGTLVTDPEFDIYTYRCGDCWGTPSPLRVAEPTTDAEGTHFLVTGVSPGRDGVFIGPNYNTGSDLLAVITVE